LGNYQDHGGVLLFSCWLFNKKSCWSMSDVRAIPAARVTPLGSQTWLFALFFDTPPCPFPHDIACNNVWCPDCHRWSFLFPSYSLSCQVKYTIVLFFLVFSILILILLIFYFVFIFLYKFYFQFSPSITISHMLYFSFRSLLFWFFFMALLLKAFLAFNFIIKLKFLLFYFF